MEQTNDPSQTDSRNTNLNLKEFFEETRKLMTTIPDPYTFLIMCFCFAILIIMFFNIFFTRNTLFSASEEFRYYVVIVLFIFLIMVSISKRKRLKKESNSIPTLEQLERQEQISADEFSVDGPFFIENGNPHSRGINTLHAPNHANRNPVGGQAVDEQVPATPQQNNSPEIDRLPATNHADIARRNRMAAARRLRQNFRPTFNMIVNSTGPQDEGFDSDDSFYDELSQTDED